MKEKIANSIALHQMTINELKDIKDYEGLYKISNFGRVKTLEKTVWNGKAYLYFSEKIRKLNVDKDGYLNITLNKNR